MGLVSVREEGLVWEVVRALSNYEDCMRGWQQHQQPAGGPLSGGGSTRCSMNSVAGAVVAGAASSVVLGEYN